MKKSLHQSIKLFNLLDRFKIYWVLLCKKIQIATPQSLEQLFLELIYYASFFEKGVTLKNEDSRLMRVSLTINNKSLIVFVRKHSSDLEVLDSVLLNGEYNIAVYGLQYNLNKSHFSFIDAGGNIGLTTLFFYCYYPESKFVVIEPDKENLMVLNKNLQANELFDVIVLHKALWVSEDSLIIENSFRDGREWSLTVNEIEHGRKYDKCRQIGGISLFSIIEEYNIAEIDLFKIDIEGAESSLFNNDRFINAVKRYVKRMVIEIHDEFNIRKTIMQKMQDAGFLSTESGNVTFFEKQ